MNESVIRQVAAGWISVMVWVGGAGQTGLAEPAVAPQMTLFVYNRAQVAQDTLTKASEVAARIFHDAGIKVSVVVDPPPTVQAETGPTLPPLRTFFVQILSPEMVKRLGLPSTVLGLAPGTPKEQDRNKIYVFDHVAARMAREQAMSRARKTVAFRADKGQILGYAIAHEIGHVLLNLAAHTKRGIMQANWEGYALEDIATGRLHFSPEEATRIQAEVARRSRN